MGRKEPTSAAQQKGSEVVHAPIENYLKTGQKALPPIVLAGAHFIPEPGPDLLVEHPIAGALKVSGIPMIGYIDLMHGRDHYIDSEGGINFHKNESLIEVVDWKSTGDLSRAKKGGDLAETTQMVSYAKYAFERAPDCEGVRLSHVYFRTKGTPLAKKATILVRRDDIAPEWKKLEHVGKMLLDIARQTSESCVEANTRACDAYGGCPHRSYCGGGNRKQLEKLFGVGVTMGLLDAVNLKPEVKAEMAALQAAEAPAPVGYAPEFAAAVDYILASGKGFPALGTPAAKAYAAYKKIQFSGHGWAGTGELGVLTMQEPDTVIQLAEELKGVLAKSAAPPPAPVNTTSIQDALPALLPPDAPASAPPATDSDRSTMSWVSPVPEAPKKRGRKPKEVSSPAEAAVSPPSSALVAPTPTPNTPFAGLVLFVDCIPSMAYQTLDAYVDRLCEVLCTECKAADIRCAPADGPLGFGKWKGAIAALAKESPPEAGVYVLDTRGREIAEVVADALRGKCSAFVRGIR
jgi:hypothetical protein